MSRWGKWDQTSRSIGRFERIHGGHWQWHRIPTHVWNHRESNDRLQVYGEFCWSAIHRPYLHVDWYDNDELAIGIAFGTDGSDPVVGVDFEIRLSGWRLTVASWLTGFWRGLRGA